MPRAARNGVFPRRPGLWTARLTEIEGSLLPLRGKLRVSLISVVLLGLGLYSYHARELLVCWLFFLLLFVPLALVILGGVLACYAGKYVLDRAGTAARSAPAAALGAGELHLEGSPALAGSTAVLPAESGLPNPG
jgi:hypothetical protein